LEGESKAKIQEKMARLDNAIHRSK